jgi:hypothetical protein
VRVQREHTKSWGRLQYLSFASPQIWGILPEFYFNHIFVYHYYPYRPFIMGGGGAAPAGFDAALERREALMGKSGPGALVKNFKVFRIALFACLGGVLYGYNQGMFSGILAMPSFGKRTVPIFAIRCFIYADQ